MTRMVLHSWMAQTVALDAITVKGRRRSREQIGATWLFEVPERKDPEVPTLPEPDSEVEGYRRFRALGVSVDKHPLEFEPAEHVTLARDLTTVPSGTLITVNGIVVTRRQVTAKNDKGKSAMSFVTLEDRTGLIESVWFPAAYRTYGSLLDQGVPLRLKGFVEFHFGFPSITVREVETVSQ